MSAAVEDKCLTILEDARALIARPDGWVRGKFSVGVGMSGYVAYCALGALHQAGLANPSQYDCAITAVRAALPPNALGITYFNDYIAGGKRDVLRVFDKAIAARQEETRNEV